jgi:hypothetical protein
VIPVHPRSRRGRLAVPDRRTVRTRTKRTSDPRTVVWLVWLVCLGTGFVTLIDQSMVGVVVPALRADLDASATVLSATASSSACGPLLGGLLTGLVGVFVPACWRRASSRPRC